MSHEILRSIFSEVRANKFFTVLANETGDISRVEQLVIMVRHVSCELEVSEDLLGLHSLERSDSETISKTILDVLLRCMLPLEDLRGQAYDGGSAMAGSKTGVAVRIQQKQPKALYVHCQAHSLSLVVQDAVCKSNNICHFMENVNELINFIRGSCKRVAEFKALAIEMGNDSTLRPLCPTRWTLRYKSLIRLRGCIPVVRQEFFNISQDETADRQARAKAQGFLGLLASFDFIFNLEVTLQLFEVTDRLSKSLQATEMTAGEGKSMTLGKISGILKRNAGETKF